jgi:hypothetical protein
MIGGIGAWGIYCGINMPGDVVHCKIYEKMHCIENGEDVYYLDTDIGRINASRSKIENIPINVSIEIQLVNVKSLINDDPMKLYRVVNAPCETMRK